MKYDIYRRQKHSLHYHQIKLINVKYPDRSTIVEQAKFTYYPLRKAFENKQNRVKSKEKNKQKSLKLGKKEFETLIFLQFSEKHLPSIKDLISKKKEQ